MASGRTDTVFSLDQEEPLASVEYTLSLSDYHALDMFVYENVLRKSLRFRSQFYAVALLMGAAGAAAGGLMIWGLFRWLASLGLPLDLGSVSRASVTVAALLFLAVVVGIIPGSFLHRAARTNHAKRFWRVRRAQFQAGVLKYKARYRVTLAPERFTERIECREAETGIEITETQITRVEWVRVSRIDVTEEHAFFTVERVPSHKDGKGWLILPRRIFRDEATFSRFVETARDFRVSALRAPAPTPVLPPSSGTDITE